MRRLKFLAIGAALTATLIAAAPAAAATSEAGGPQPTQAAADPGCYDNRLCIHADIDGGSDRLYITHEYFDLSYRTCSGCANGTTWNDQMSSFTNNSDGFYSWYEDINYQGACHNIGPKSGTFNLPPRENDKASSIKHARCP